MKNNREKNIISPFLLLILNFFKKLNFKKYDLLILFQFYSIITVILFYFGPINYPNVNVGKTITLIILYNTFFILGYLLADRKIFLENKELIFNDSKLRIFFLIGAVLSIFFSVTSIVNYSNTLNPLDIFKNIQMGLTHPGESYFRNIELEKKSGIITQLMTLFSPLTYAIVPFGLFYHRKLGLYYKILLITVILFDLSTFIIKGTNLGIFKIAIIFFAVFLINKGKVKISLVSKLILSFALFYFFFSISSRMQLTSIPDTIFHIEVNKEHLLFKILPISLSVPLMIGISYISQGYYGLSLASLYNFESTFGFGNGRFLISKVNSLFNFDVWERTYQYKMELVWDSRVNWHTIYVWFANDVSLYGVIIIMGVIGFLFNLILKDSRENNSLLGIILLPLYLLMLIFVPANNIIFDNPLLFIPFVFLNLLWIFSKRWRVRK